MRRRRRDARCVSAIRHGQVLLAQGKNILARESQRQTHNAIFNCEWAFPDGFTVSEEGKAFIRQLLRKAPTERPTATEALKSKWLSPDAPSSPGALMSSDPNRSVKQMLWDFNAQRMLAKVVKGAHRRLSTDQQKELEQQRAHGVLVPVRPEEGRVCQHVHLRPACVSSRGERLSWVPWAAGVPRAC